MASPIHGRRGRLYVGLTSSASTAESVANLTGFSIDFSTDDVEVTAFGDSNKVYVSGLPDCSGSFKGFLDTGTAQLYTAAADGDARKFYLYPTTSNTGIFWSGTAIFDFSVESDVGDAVKVSGNFKAASTVSKTG